MRYASDVVREFDASLSPEAQALLARAAAFSAEHVAPHARDWEYQRQPPLDTLVRACRAGLAGVEVPAAQGGLGLGFGARVRMVETLARDDAAFAFSLVNHHNVTARLASLPDSPMAAWVPAMMAGELIGCTAMTEPGAGSDFSAIAMQARRVPGGWSLTGEKAWITNAAVANVFLTYAQTEPGSGPKGIAGFVVRVDPADEPGLTAFTRRPAFALHGAHAIGAGGFALDAFFVPDEQVMSAPGTGFKAAMAGVNSARTYVAALCAGMLEESLARAIAYAESRHAFRRPVLDNQGLRWSLTDVATELEAMRLLTYRATRLIEAGQDAQWAAAVAKKFANERAEKGIAACMQAMGAHGLRSELPLARHLATARVLSYTDGSVEMMNERIGHLLRAV